MKPEMITTPITYSFRFSRRRSRWEVYEHEGRGQRRLSGHECSDFPTKDAARAWAAFRAQAKGHVFAEYVKPPPPTPEEKHRGELHDCCRRVGFFDHQARAWTSGADKNSLGEARAHQDAAACWQRAAEWCMRAAALDLSRRDHYVLCAQSRLKNARRSLVRWIWALGEPAPRARLKGMAGGGENPSPAAAHLSLVPADLEPNP